MSGPVSTTQRLAALRALLSKADRWGGALQALIVPSEDAHQSEYVATAFERRTFISGFTGSAGCAVVSTSQAALWTDGRYFAQAEKELDSNWQLMKQGLPDTPSQEDWLNSVSEIRGSLEMPQRC
jgi:Xaa-Pro aminopeptidase